MDPKFSVVIPVYNGVGFADRAIDSALAQTYPAHEVIVIDDGSKDATPELLARYGDRVRSKRIPNGGASNARNVGMAMATGDWIAFLDHDDVWFRSKLARTAEAARRFPEAGAVFSNYVLRAAVIGNRMLKHHSKLRELGRMNFDAPLRSNAFELLLRENFTGTPSAAAVRRSVAEKVGPYADHLRPSEDFDYWLRCATVAPFVVLSEPLLYKRTHDRNLSNDRVRINRSHRKVVAEALVKHEAYLRAHGLRGLCLDSIADTDYRLGDIQFEAGHAEEAFASYRQALVVRPSPANALRYLAKVARKRARLLLRRAGR